MFHYPLGLKWHSVGHLTLCLQPLQLELWVLGSCSWHVLVDDTQGACLAHFVHSLTCERGIRALCNIAED